LLKRLDPKPRLLISIAASLLIYSLTPGWLQPVIRIIISWNFGVIWFLILVWVLLRRLALVHQVLTFFFNTLILALGINILASLI
jgi:uncharacterized membrane protein